MLARSGNVFAPSDLAKLTDASAVGDISLRFLDSDGRLVKTPLDDRVIGMLLTDLAKVDRATALAGGQSEMRLSEGHCEPDASTF